MHSGWGRDVRRAGARQGKAHDLGADRAPEGPRQPRLPHQHLRELRGHLRRSSAHVAGGRRDHGVRPGAGPDHGGHRQRQHRGFRLLVADDAGEDRAGPGGRAPAQAAGHLPGRLLRSLPPGAGAHLPRETRRRLHLQDELAALGERRPADRRRAGRLHRGRRLHADHLRQALHDRAGVHGDRRRGSRQRRQVAEHHLALDRRARTSTSISPTARTSACPTTRP